MHHRKSKIDITKSNGYRYIGYSLLLTIMGACGQHMGAQEAADLILHNANIITVDEDFSQAKTLVIRDDRIVYVGNRQNISAWQDSTTQVIDLQGKTVLPGFIEPHTHPIASAVLYKWTDVSGITHKTAKSALTALKKTVKETPEGEWILGFGWDMILLEDAMALDRDFLDREISSEHPVWIMMQSMHTSYFNSMALERAGITDQTPNPIGGGEYKKDSNGRLTGIVTESATLTPFVKALPHLSHREGIRDMLRMYGRYNAAGISTIGATGLLDIFPGISGLQVCRDIAQSDWPPIRLYYYDVGTPQLQDSLPDTDDWMLRRIGQKYWIDGSPYTGSMLIDEPYLNTPLTNEKLDIPFDSHGHQMYPQEIYRAMIDQADSLGWQIAIHAQGDSASRIALDLLAQTATTQERRHRMEHLALVERETLQSMAEIGVTPSFHINHVYYYGDELSDYIIGQTRADRLMPLADALDFDHHLTLHNDSPMYPPSPLLAIQTAVTRTSRTGRMIGGEQAISIDEAIKAVTINAAWQLHAEDEIGSLEVGKKADFVILSDDPMIIDPHQIAQIRVIATFVNGKKAI